MLLLGFASFHPARARALELSWSAPSECSSVAAQRARIVQLLARQGLGSSALRVTGTVTREQGHYRLALRIATPSHEAVRAVQLSDCAAVDQAALAFIEMAVEPALAGSTPARAGAPTVAEGGGRPAVAEGSGRPASRKRGAGVTGARRPALGKRAVQRSAETPTPPPSDAEVALAETSPPSEGREPDAAAPSVPAVAPSSKAEAATVRGPTEPPAARSQSTPRADPPAAREAEVRPTIPKVTSSFAAPGSARRWGRVAAQVGLWSGGLPLPQVDTGARAGLGRGALYGELRADWMLPRTERLDWDAMGTVRMRSFAIGLAGCGAFGAWADRVRVGPCARLSVLRTAGAVKQITEPRDVQVVWLVSALSALLGVRVFGPLEVSVEAGAGLPLTERPRFLVSGRGTAQEARLFSLHATLGIGLRWEQKRSDTSQNAPPLPIGR